MATINISLPDPLKDFVDEQVAERRLPSASDYVGELIREEQKRRAQEKLKQLLLEGLNSGPPIEMTAADWEELKQRVWERHEKGKADETNRSARTGQAGPERTSRVHSKG